MHPRIFFGLLVITISALHAAEPPRVWSSRDGKAKITAAFYKAEGDKITLILPNGRTQSISLKYLSDADAAWVAEHKTTSITAGKTDPAGGAPKSAKIPAALQGKLIDADGQPVEITTDGTAPKYYIFYSSASWCFPCHLFTPRLIQFYRRMKARQASFEVILVPEDKTEEAEIAYLKKMRMPWPGLAFAHRVDPNIPSSSSRYIPSMILVDAAGHTLLDVGPALSNGDFLEKAGAILAPKTTAK